MTYMMRPALILTDKNRYIRTSAPSCSVTCTYISVLRKRNVLITGLFIVIINVVST